MKKIDCLTIELDNRELSDLYSIVSDARRSEVESKNRTIMEEWQSKWSDIYKSSPNYYMVFNRDEVDILFNVMRYTNNYYNLRAKNEKRVIVNKFMEFMSKYTEDEVSKREFNISPF
jgi:hypothetical protein